MRIKAHIANGYLVFECDGVFVEPVERVVLSRETRQFSFVFGRSGDVVALDCPVDDETVRAVGAHDRCGIGLFYRGALMASALAPLEVRDGA